MGIIWNILGVIIFGGIFSTGAGLGYHKYKADHDDSNFILSSLTILLIMLCFFLVWVWVGSNVWM